METSKAPKHTGTWLTEQKMPRESECHAYFLEGNCRLLV